MKKINTEKKETPFVEEEGRKASFPHDLKDKSDLDLLFLCFPKQLMENIIHYTNIRGYLFTEKLNLKRRKQSIDNPQKIKRDINWTDITFPQFLGFLG